MTSVASALALRSVAYIRHQVLDLGFQVGGQRQQRQAHRAAEVAVEIQSVLDARNAQFSYHSLRGLGNSRLFQLGQFDIAFFPRGMNLVAGCGRRIGEGENRTHCSHLQRRF